MKNRFRFFSSSQGFTLIEILVSITILSIIVTTFLMLFIQSAKTNAHSERILEATYIAQSQMEEIRFLSTDATFETAVTRLKSDGYTRSGSDEPAMFFLMKKMDGFQVAVTMNRPGSADNLGHLLVEVSNPSGNTVAQMETILNWEQTESDGSNEK